MIYNISSMKYCISLLVVVALIGCSSNSTDVTDTPNEMGEQGPQAAKILVLGDSLSTSFGVPTPEGWVSLLEDELDDLISESEVSNASANGESTQGGLERMPALLVDISPDLLILQLGANDGFRGRTIEDIRTDIEIMTVSAQQAGAKVIIAGIMLPADFGEAYTSRFFNLFREASENTGATLIPDFLSQVRGDDTLFQDDGIHPTATAQPLIHETVFPVVLDVLDIQISAISKVSLKSRI